MIIINKKQDGEKLTVQMAGRLDTQTELVFDLKEVEYISSAGLRVLLYAQKVMNKQGSMVVCNVQEDIQEIFEVTGFVDILTIV